MAMGTKGCHRFNRTWGERKKKGWKDGRGLTTFLLGKMSKTRQQQKDLYCQRGNFGFLKESLTSNTNRGEKKKLILTVMKYAEPVIILLYFCLHPSFLLHIYSPQDAAVQLTKSASNLSFKPFQSEEFSLLSEPQKRV